MMNTKNIKNPTKSSLLCLLLCLFLAACGADNEQEEIPQTITGEDVEESAAYPEETADLQGLTEIRGSLVFIDSGSYCGSGFIWDYEEDMIIVTAAHVLQDTEGAITVRLSDGYELSPDEYSVCTDSDLAFLRIDGKRIPELHKEYYCEVLKSEGQFNSMLPGATMYAVGYAGEDEILINQGELLDKWMYVSDFPQYMVLVQAVVEQGMSGGGVFDAQGYCMGIICGKNEDDEVAAVPFHVIEAEAFSVRWS